MEGLAEALHQTRKVCAKNGMAYEEELVICQLNNVGSIGWLVSAAIMQREDRRRAIPAARLDFFFSALIAVRDEAIVYLYEAVRSATKRFPGVTFEILGAAEAEAEALGYLYSASASPDPGDRASGSDRSGKHTEQLSPAG